jgi:hypothetical protein
MINAASARGMSCAVRVYTRLRCVPVAEHHFRQRRESCWVQCTSRCIVSCPCRMGRLVTPGRCCSRACGPKAAFLQKAKIHNFPNYPYPSDHRVAVHYLVPCCSCYCCSGHQALKSRYSKRQHHSTRERIVRTPLFSTHVNLILTQFFRFALALQGVVRKKFACF